MHTYLETQTNLQIEKLRAPKITAAQRAQAVKEIRELTSQYEDKDTAANKLTLALHHLPKGSREEKDVLSEIHKIIPKIKDPDWATYCYFVIHARIGNDVSALLAIGDELITHYCQTHNAPQEQRQFLKEEINQRIVLEKRAAANNNPDKILKHGLLGNQMLEALFTNIEAIEDLTAREQEYIYLLQNKSYPEWIARQVISQILKHNSQKNIDAERCHLFSYAANDVTGWSSPELIKAAIDTSLDIERPEVRITALERSMLAAKEVAPDLYRQNLPLLIIHANDLEKVEDRLNTWEKVATFLKGRDPYWLHTVYGYMLGACMDDAMPAGKASHYAKQIALDLMEKTPQESSNEENMLRSMAHETWRKATLRYKPLYAIINDARSILIGGYDQEFKEKALDLFTTTLPKLKAPSNIDATLHQCREVLKEPTLSPSIRQKVSPIYFKTFFHEENLIKRCCLYAEELNQAPQEYQQLLAENLFKMLDHLPQEDALSTCIKLLQKDGIHEVLKTGLEDHCIMRLCTRWEDESKPPFLSEKLSDHLAALYAQPTDSAFTDRLLVSFEVIAAHYPDPQQRIVYKIAEKQAPLGSPLQQHLHKKLVDVGDKPFIPGIPVRCTVRLPRPRQVNPHVPRI